MSYNSSGTSALKDIHTQLHRGRRAYEVGDFKTAHTICISVLSEDKNQPDALQLLSAVTLQQGDAKTAAILAQRCVKADPNNPYYRNALGLAHSAAGQFDAAINEFDKAIDIRSDIINSHANKASTLIDSGRYEAAIGTIDAVLTESPNNVLLLSNKGVALSHLGLNDKALSLLIEAQRIRPDSLDICRNKLMVMNYCNGTTAKAVRQETEMFWDLKEASGTRVQAFKHFRDQSQSAKRPLRIGYVSADFRTHPVGLLLEPVLAHLDRDQVETFLYSNHPARDELTDTLEAHCAGSRSIFGKSDSEACMQIQDDHIDILIDLSGHTDGNRLPLFRRKPAPVQMTWLGYAATTGLTEIDYIITDIHVCVDGDETYFTEKPLKLPNLHFCFRPYDIKIAVSDIAADRQQPFVFGCFNNVSKFSEGLIRQWAEILAAVPDSKLMVKNPKMSREDVSRSITSLCARHGIAPDRLLLVGQTSFEDHLASYRGVDVALDPFPYNGTMSTLDALWMGVPVVTLRGNRWLARVGAAIALEAGLPDLVCETEEEYVEKAIALAHQPERLSALRKSLRIILETSPVCDSKGFTKSLESLYQQTWQAWCMG